MAKKNGNKPADEPAAKASPADAAPKAVQDMDREELLAEIGQLRKALKASDRAGFNSPDQARWDALNLQLERLGRDA